MMLPSDTRYREDLPTTSTEPPSEVGSIPSWSSSLSPRDDCTSVDPTRLVVRGIISEGASGVVYLVRDTARERDAAMKVARLTRGVLAEVKLLRKLSRTPHAFLLAPYSGAKRYWWESPSGDLHILTVSRFARVSCPLTISWMQEYYAGGTLEAYLGLLSHREVWLVTAELVHLPATPDTAATMLTLHRSWASRGSTRNTSSTTHSARATSSSAATVIVSSQASSPAGESSRTVRGTRAMSTPLS